MYQMTECIIMICTLANFKLLIAYYAALTFNGENIVFSLLFLSVALFYIWYIMCFNLLLD